MSTASGPTDTATRTPRSPLASVGGLGWIGLLCRLVLGAVLIVAGALKVGDLDQSVLAVRGYQVLPYDLAVVVGYVLPPLEIFVGALLVLGLFTRWAAVLGGLMMAAFVVGIAQAWIRGLSIDCGCFGGGGEVAPDQTRYAVELARDVALLAVAAFLVAFPRTPFALEDRLFGPPPALDGLDSDPDTADR